jgi:hypothetical protein
MQIELNVQLELSVWLEQCPLLQHTHAMIRSHEHPHYMSALDRFVEQCLVQLDAFVPALGLFATDPVVGVDILFETLNSVKAIPTLLKRLPVPATLSAAQADETGLRQTPANLETAVRLHLAHLVILGYQQVAIIEPTLADKWVNMYHRTVTTYLSQQADQTSLALTLDQPCQPLSFDQAVQHYVTRFDETGALPMYVIGMLPFSPHASHSLFDAVNDMLPLLNPVFRLAQEVVFDAKEVLNAGIFAFASENGLSLAQAVRQIHDSLALQSDISARLAQSYYEELKQTEETIEATLATHPHNAWLMAFSQDVLVASQAMTHKWKPA